MNVIPILKKTSFTFWVLLLFVFSPILRMKRYDVIFVINPGTEEVPTSYEPKWIVRFLKEYQFFKKHYFPAFFIRGNNFTGIMMTNFTTTNEIISNPHELQKSLKNLDKWQPNRFALGGVLSGLVARNQLQNDLRKEFIIRQSGTLFLIYQCIEQLVLMYPHLALAKREVSIIGSGYSGQALAPLLESKGFKINMFDVTDQRSLSESPNIRFMLNRFQQIERSGLVILLTSKGDEGIHSIESYLTPSMVVLSNTYPEVSASVIRTLRKRGVILHSCRISIPGLRIVPKHKHIDSSFFGGCFLQSYVEALVGRSIDEYEEFCLAAKELGVVAELSKSDCWGAITK